MVNVEFMYTLAQVSATIVAIVAGFFTAKLISISTDKQRIFNLIKTTDIQIKKVKDANVESQKIMQHIQFALVRMRLDVLEGWMALKEPEERTITKEDLLAIYEREYRNKLDEKDPLMQLLDSEIDKVNERVNAKIRDKLTNRQSFQEKLINSDGVLRNKENNPHRENAILDAEFQKLMTNKHELAYLESMKRQYESELDVIYSPKLIVSGLCVIIAFAITGVMMPMVFVLNMDTMPDYIDNLAFVLFSLGLIVTIIHIGLEVQNALITVNKTSTTSKPDG